MDAYSLPALPEPKKRQLTGRPSPSTRPHCHPSHPADPGLGADHLCLAGSYLTTNQPSLTPDSASRTVKISAIQSPRNDVAAAHSGVALASILMLVGRSVKVTSQTQPILDRLTFSTFRTIGSQIECREW